jgi:predicted acyltransferase
MVGTPSEQLGAYDFTSILCLIGLAYFPALLMRSPVIALAAAPLILGLTAVAYFAYMSPHGGGPGTTAQTSRISRSTCGCSMPCHVVHPTPATRTGTTRCNAPMIASIIIGALAGRRMVQRPNDNDRLALEFALIGLAGLIATATVAACGILLVKSLWTPTWVLFSSSLCLLTLAVFTIVFDRPGGVHLAFPLVVLGTNALLLYVIASVHRWRIVMYGERLLGPLITEAAWRPLLQSVLVLAVLWLVAAVLHWRRIRVTL